MPELRYEVWFVTDTDLFMHRKSELCDKEICGRERYNDRLRVATPTHTRADARARTHTHTDAHSHTHVLPNTDTSCTHPSHMLLAGVFWQDSDEFDSGSASSHPRGDDSASVSSSAVTRTKHVFRCVPANIGARVHRACLWLTIT